MITILTDFSNLFHGIQAFITSEICHNDIKLENIVYDKPNWSSSIPSIPNNMKFIDFGLSTSFEIIQKSTENTYKNSFIYPPEVVLLNEESIGTSYSE